MMEACGTGSIIQMFAQMIAVHLADIIAVVTRPHTNCKAHIQSENEADESTSSRNTFHRDLSLEVIAAEAEISPIYLPRAFKMAVGYVHIRV